jgi:hypothetical protein
MSQIFNALNGAELKKAILADIEREMDLTGEFRNHVTFPWVKYTAHITLLSYPKQAMDAEPGIKITASGVATDNLVPPVAEPEVVLDLKVGSVVNVPDQARVDSDQPIPTQSLAAGILIDAPVHRVKTPLQVPKTAQVKPDLKAPASAPKPAAGSPVGIPGLDGSL